MAEIDSSCRGKRQRALLYEATSPPIIDHQGPTLSGLAVLLPLPCKPVFAASLVYIKDGNVWIATPDGTTKRQMNGDNQATVNELARAVNAALSGCAG